MMMEYPRKFLDHDILEVLRKTKEEHVVTLLVGILARCTESSNAAVPFEEVASIIELYEFIYGRMLLDPSEELGKLSMGTLLIIL